MKAISSIFSEFTELYASISGDASLSSHDIRSKVLAQKNLFTAASRIILQSRGDVVKNLTPAECKSYAELKAVLLLSVGNEKDQKSIVDVMKKELSLMLRLDSVASREIGGVLLGCLILGLDDLPSETVAHILEFLAAASGRQEGVRSTIRSPESGISREVSFRLSQLLNLGLASEVFSFLDFAETVPKVSLSELMDASVLAVGSRKGGVGKSTIIMAILLWYLGAASGEVCVVDFDVTGPVWQYLLSPDGRSNVGEPIPYLNTLFNIEQSDKSFNFGAPGAAEVLACVAPITLPRVGKNIGLLTLADWPRTNRYLVQAISNNRTSFIEFLDALISGLSTRYKLILIDNSPGFDPHSLLTLVYVGQLPRGCPVIISTPFIPDIRGTLLELGDLRLVPMRRPPVWFVNKANQRVRDFLVPRITY